MSSVLNAMNLQIRSVMNITYLVPLQDFTCNCIKGYFFDLTQTDSAKYCQSCFELCGICTYDNCTKCIESDEVILRNNKCKCNISTHIQIINETTSIVECIKCHNLCNEYFGSLNTQCTSCKQIEEVEFVESSTCRCRNEYCNEDEMRCSSCHPLCLTCYGGSSEGCLPTTLTYLSPSKTSQTFVS
jgi:hypothetical protein